MANFSIYYTKTETSGLFSIPMVGEEYKVKDFCEYQLKTGTWAKYNIYEKKNNINLDKIYYSCKVFYKTENYFGWDIVEISGENNDITEFCKKKKQDKEWFDYKIYSGHWFESDNFKELEIKKFNSDAETVGRLSWFVYNPELKKWFMDNDDIMPCPKSTPKEINNYFDIEAYYDEEWNDIESILTDYKQNITIEDWSPICSFKFSTREQECVSLIQMYDYAMDYEKFINKIKNNEYACFVVQELSQQKFLIWTVGDKVRFIIQDYDHDEVETIFDVLTDKQNFLNKLVSTVEKAKIGKQKLIEKVNLELNKKG